MRAEVEIVPTIATKATPVPREQADITNHHFEAMLCEKHAMQFLHRSPAFEILHSRKALPLRKSRQLGDRAVTSLSISSLVRDSVTAINRH